MQTKQVLFAALAVSVSALAHAENEHSNNLRSAFMQYVAKHGKTYGTVEEFEHRLKLFVATEQEIIRFNSSPQTSTIGHNKFSDWSAEERKRLTSYIPRANSTETNAVVLDDTDLPTEINWVEKGAVNAVADQAQCGSCWAFSAIAQMEGQHFIQSGKLLKLSEQQCVDCDKDSFGCAGGWQDNCMYYVMDNGGISLNIDYPYRASDGACWADWNGPVSVKKVNPVTSYNQSQLMAAIALGPTSVTVDASSSVWYYYTSGVISSTDCGTKLDHAVTAVGYGTDAETGLDYYLVRNSWGAGWGDQGYVKIARVGDGYGICGIQEISVWALTN